MESGLAESNRFFVASEICDALFTPPQMGFAASLHSNVEFTETIVSKNFDKVAAREIHTSFDVSFLPTCHAEPT